MILVVISRLTSPHRDNSKLISDVMQIPRDPFATGGLITRDSAVPLALNRSGTNAEVVITPARTRVSYMMVLFNGGFCVRLVLYDFKKRTIPFPLSHLQSRQ